MTKKIKDSGVKKQVDKQPKIAPPMPKGSQLKKIAKPIKSEPIKYEQNKIEQKTKLRKRPINTPKPKPIIEPKPKIKKLPLKKKHIQLQPKVQKPRYDSYDWLMEDKSDEEVKPLATEPRVSLSKSITEALTLLTTKNIVTINNLFILIFPIINSKNSFKL